MSQRERARIRNCVLCEASFVLTGTYLVCPKCQGDMDEKFRILARELDKLADECTDENCVVAVFLRTLAEELTA